ncbi:hypothetical protein F4808DRAFT_445733 [Astrocystis sublimbata]|nr:hypothetical protein F4808DRAFT_445733 [Astrocystis sublimbata]
MAAQLSVLIDLLLCRNFSGNARSPPSCMGDLILPLELRTALFGDSARLVLGTPAQDPNQLYSPIIAAFDDVIKNM